MKSLSHAPLSRFAAAAGVAFVGFFGTAAQAAPIASFAFQSGGGFFDATCSGGGSACNLTYSDPVDGFNTKVGWGVPGTTNATKTQSSLSVEHQSGFIPTNGTWVTTDEYKHSNFPILLANGYMNFTKVTSFINVVRPPNPDGDFVAGASGAPLFFTETPNSGTLGTCTNKPVGGWPVGYSSGVCPDFYLTVPLVGSGLLYSDAMYNYFISFRFTPGAEAVVEEIEIDGNPFVRIFTKETNPGESFVFTEAQIVARAIPEPATLALVGLGLLGAAVARKRAKRA